MTNILTRDARSATTGAARASGARPAWYWPSSWSDSSWRVLDASDRERRGPVDPRQPARLRGRPAADRGRVHDRLRGAAGDRRAARRHHRSPPHVPGRARRVHARLAGLRAGRLGRAPGRAALPPGRGRGGDDPAGAQPDPAHRRRPARARRDEQLLRGAGRRRGGGPAGRRPARQRERARFRLAAGLPGQRAHWRWSCWSRAPGRCRTAAASPAGPWTCPGWNPADSGRSTRSSCRSCSASRSTGRSGAGSRWTASVPLVAASPGSERRVADGGRDAADPRAGARGARHSRSRSPPCSRS